MTLVAGVDSSTQSCKVVIRDLESGVTVRTGRASHPDSTEVHPDQWWDALQEAIADAGGLGDVAAISVAAQQHGLVALDAQGEVVRPALLWNDTRSAGAARDLVTEIGAEQYAQRTGVVPVASFTATKLRWVRDQEPENAARIAAVALPHDWLTWRLRGFGPQNPALDQLTTDRSDASGTGYWSAATGEYDCELLAVALGRDVIVPRVLGAIESAGQTPDGLAVGVGAGDNAAAALGLAIADGDVVVSLGTSGTVFTVSDTPVVDASGTVTSFADATGRELPLVCTLNAARVLDAAAAMLGVDHDELAELALQAPAGAGGLTLVPYLEGERTPNLPTATGTIRGLTLGTATPAHLARAAVEGMLSGLAAGYDAIINATGITPSRVLLIGGAARNPAVRHVAGTVFPVPVVVPEPGEYVANGAAAQAAAAITGALPTWPQAPAIPEPSQPIPAVREQYQRWAALEL